MSTRRTQKAAAAVREVVSMAILADLKDPRVRDVTVTAVEVAGDMRQAKIYVSVMGDETKQQLSLRGLRNAAGFLQSKIASRIDTRYTPKLEFILDLGVKQSIEIARILHEVLPPEPTAGGAAEGVASDEGKDISAAEIDAVDEFSSAAPRTSRGESADSFSAPDSDSLAHRPSAPTGSPP